MGHLCHVPFPKNQGSFKGRMQKVCKSQKRWMTIVKLFSGHNLAVEPMNSQCLVSMHKICTRSGHTESQHQVGRYREVLLLGEELLAIDGQERENPFSLGMRPLNGYPCSRNNPKPTHPLVAPREYRKLGGISGRERERKRYMGGNER